MPSERESALVKIVAEHDQARKVPRPEKKPSLVKAPSGSVFAPPAPAQRCACSSSPRPPRPGYTGHVICSNCERLYTTYSSQVESHWPRHCVCGQPLRPSWVGRLVRRYETAARMICMDCVLNILVRRAGAVST